MATQSEFEREILKRAHTQDRRELARDTRAVNTVLGAFTYHDSVPLAEVNTTLVANGFDCLEDMILCGRSGQLHEPVGRNRWLSLSWYQMESGRYEVIAYLS